MQHHNEEQRRYWHGGHKVMNTLLGGRDIATWMSIVDVNVGCDFVSYKAQGNNR
jgi:hypothetical protein